MMKQQEAIRKQIEEKQKLMVKQVLEKVKKENEEKQRIKM